MKKIRSLKLLTITLLIFASLLLVACGDGEATDEAVTDDGGEVVVDDDGGDEDVAGMDNDCIFPVELDATIVFSGWGDETEQQIYRDSIVRFNEVCPNVVVDYQPIPADFNTVLQAGMAGGTAPDAFYVNDGLMTSFGPTGQLLALDSFMADAGTSRDDFIPALLGIFTQDGETLALPKDWGTLGLVYLPGAFEAAGIDVPTADWTWDDLRDAAQTISETTEYSGFCQNHDWARFAPWVFSNGGSYVSEDYSTAMLDSAEVLGAANYLADMYTDGSAVTSGDISAGWCGEAVGLELIGMTFEGGWMVNYMRSDYPDVEWVAVPLPAGPVGTGDVIFTNGIGVNASTDFPLAAAAFTIFVTGADNQGEIVLTGFAYSTHPEQIDLVVDSNDAAIAVGGTFDLTQVGYWGPYTGGVNDAIGQALERVALGEQTVEEAFAQAQTEAQAALDGD